MMYCTVVNFSIKILFTIDNSKMVVKLHLLHTYFLQTRKDLLLNIFPSSKEGFPEKLNSILD